MVTIKEVIKIFDQRGGAVDGETVVYFASKIQEFLMAHELSPQDLGDAIIETDAQVSVMTKLLLYFFGGEGKIKAADFVTSEALSRKEKEIMELLINKLGNGN